jgi:hypothetical protein
MRWGAKHRDLLAREERLAEALELLNREREKLRRQERELVIRTEVLRLEKQAFQVEQDHRRARVEERVETMKVMGPLGNDPFDERDTRCAHCEVIAATTSYRIFNSETKRTRKQWLCSDECAWAMEEEQRELVDGMAYVRKSLGVTP